MWSFDFRSKQKPLFTCVDELAQLVVEQKAEEQGILIEYAAFAEGFFFGANGVGKLYTGLIIRQSEILYTIKAQRLSGNFYQAFTQLNRQAPASGLRNQP